MAEIKISYIDDAGYGVFATKKYIKGELICKYDCEERPVNNREDWIYSLFNADTGKTYIGITPPRDSFSVGQYINDGCILSLTEDDKDIRRGFCRIDCKKFKDKIIEYYYMSNMLANVDFIMKDFNLYATKDIEKGQELYLSYGADYWMSNICQQNKEPLVILYFLLKLNILKIDSDILYLGDIKASPCEVFQILCINSDCDLIVNLKYDKLSDLDKIKNLIKLAC